MTNNEGYFMENNNNVRFEDFFNDRMHEHGLNVKKLSELSGVAVKHIESLSSGDFLSLPPAPYFRGYLNRLGQILDFDPDFWWRKFKIGDFTENSGEGDKMPQNRFINKISGKVAWVAVLVIGAVSYFAIRAPMILGKPSITITFPAGNPSTSAAAEILLQGFVENTTELFIDGEFVPISEDGTWGKTLLLAPGRNSLEITAKKFLGGGKKVVQQIFYEPPKSESTSTQTFN